MFSLRYFLLCLFSSLFYKSAPFCISDCFLVISSIISLHKTHFQFIFLRAQTHSEIYSIFLWKKHFFSNYALLPHLNTMSISICVAITLSKLRVGRKILLLILD